MVAFALVVHFTLPAMGSSSGQADYLVDLWTSDDGLPDSSVTAIAQTPDGYLWLGTFNGLVRFDGVRFVSFDPLNTPELKHARVDGLFVDALGTLWINTRDGSMTAWHDGVFTHEWQGGQVTAVFARTNQIFFVLLRGQLVSRTGNLEAHGAWQTINLAGRTAGNSFREDRSGVIWYFTRDGALERIVGTNAAPLTGENSLSGERVQCLTTDDQGCVWVGTEKRILLWRAGRFEDQTPTNGERVVNTQFIACGTNQICWVVANGLVRKCVNRNWVKEEPSWQDLLEANKTFLGSYEDRDGGVWFRNFGRGLFHAGPDGSTEHITAADGLPDDRVSCWFQDREGNIWVGVDRGGLVRLRKRQFHVLGVAEGLRVPAVSTVCEDANNNVWIGTFGSGLNCWRGGVLTRHDLPDGANPGSFFSAYPDNHGRIWLSAGREDLFVLETNRISPAPTSIHGIKVILVDHQGRVWLGKQNGLNCLTTNGTINFNFQNSFERKDVRALAEDPQGNIWIGAGDGMLYKFSGEKFTPYRVNDTLENQAIWSLLPDAGGTLWIGTFRGGLLRLQNGKFTRYTTQDGLPSDIICQILDDGQGRLWFGSHKGIFYVPKTAFKDFDAGKIKSLPCIAYGLYDGLPTLECSGNYQPSCWRGRDGQLWFATVKGLVSVHPGEVSINRLPPPVVIERVVVDGKPTTPEARAPATVLRIPPGRHQFDIHYTALSFSAPDKVRFRYRLAGLEDDWVDADGKRSAHYGPLRPGKYRFRVIACNNDGVWSQTGATVTLQVQPYFWQTSWFAILTTLIAMVIVIGAVRLMVARHLRQKLEQFKQQRAIQLERERIAKDIHDDVGAGLTQIMLQSALACRATHEQTPAHLAQISETAHELVGAMDEIVWAINPENDTLDGLINYVGKFFQEYATLAGLRCRLDLPAQPPVVVLSAAVRHHVFLAVKETLNNAVKHAAASEVSLRLKIAATGFSFVIKDDGRGFTPGGNPAAPANSGRLSSGHGLRNLVNRMETVGGTCTIRSAPGEGTEVELTVMLKIEDNPRLNRSQPLLEVPRGSAGENKTK